MYILAPDQYPYSISQLRNDNPQTSFPTSPTDSTLAEFGVYPVSPTERPVFNAATHRLVEGAPVQQGAEWVQTWGVVALSAEEVRSIAKAEREQAVANIKVTTQAGNTFDGDEVSQNRMNRAITGLQVTGTPSITWVLADNTVIQATATELAEALALSGAAQAAIWVIE